MTLRGDDHHEYGLPEPRWDEVARQSHGKPVRHPDLDGCIVVGTGAYWTTTADTTGSNQHDDHGEVLVVVTLCFDKPAFEAWCDAGHLPVSSDSPGVHRHLLYMAPECAADLTHSIAKAGTELIYHQRLMATGGLN